MREKEQWGDFFDVMKNRKEKSNVLMRKALVKARKITNSKKKKNEGKNLCKAEETRYKKK